MSLTQRVVKRGKEDDQKSCSVLASIDQLNLDPLDFVRLYTLHETPQEGDTGQGRAQENVHFRASGVACTEKHKNRVANSCGQGGERKERQSKETKHSTPNTCVQTHMHKNKYHKRNKKLDTGCEEETVLQKQGRSIRMVPQKK